MGYDSYVQLPEGKHMENLEGHIASNLTSLQEIKGLQGANTNTKKPGSTQNRLLLSCSTLAWHMGFVWS